MRREPLWPRREGEANERHWNTAGLRGDLPAEAIRQWVGDSYALVATGLPARLRAEVGG